MSIGKVSGLPRRIGEHFADSPLLGKMGKIIPDKVLRKRLVKMIVKDVRDPVIKILEQGPGGTTLCHGLLL